MSECPHPHDLQSFVDGEIYGAQAACTEEHVRHCSACASRVEAYEQVRYTLLRARRVRPAEDLLERILGLLRRVSPVRRLACREARVLASAYIDDELSQEERETLETHLFACDDCFTEYAQMRDAAGIMRATPPARAGESLKRRILAAVAEEASQPTPVLRPSRTAAPSWYRTVAPALAAAAVFLFALGVFQLSGGTGGQAEAPAERIATAPAPAPVEASASRPEAPPEPAVGAAATPASQVEAAPPVVVAPSGAPAPTDQPVAEAPIAPTARAAAGGTALAERPARRPGPERPTPAPAAIAAVDHGSSAPGPAAGSSSGGGHSRLASADRSRPKAPVRPRTPSTRPPTPAPLRGPAAGGSGGAPKLTRPEPRPTMVAMEETPEDDLQPKEWVEKRPETATRLYSYSGGNGERLAAASSTWTRNSDSGGGSRPGLSDEAWPTN